MEFLTEKIWPTLTKSVSENKQNLVAVAYFGSGGAELLPLKDGDILVVDVSLPQVKAGVVDPKELRKLAKEGVRVFSYQGLHAKVYVLGEIMFLGSANVSRNSCENLQEAVIKETNSGLVTQAKRWIEDLACSELFIEDIERLIPFYNPPKIRGQNKVLEIVEKCLYLVNVDFFSNFSSGYQDPLEKGESKVEKKNPGISKKEFQYFQYDYKPGFGIGDYLLIRSENANGHIMINKPCRVLHIQPWGFDEKYFVFYSKPQGYRMQIEKATKFRRKTDGFLTRKETERLMRSWGLNFNEI